MVLCAEKSTSDKAVKKKEEFHSTTAVTLSVIDDIYCRFKLSFTVENIQMELFTGDRDMVNFVVVSLNPVAEVHS